MVIEAKRAQVAKIEDQFLEGIFLFSTAADDPVNSAFDYLTPKT